MPVIVQTVTSKVSAMWGRSFIRDPQGRMRPLQVGEVVVRGDVILTDQNAIVELSLLPDPKTLAALQPAAPAEAADTSDMDKVIAGIEAGDKDVAPTAGVASADGGLQAASYVDRVSEVAGATAAPLAPSGLTLAAPLPGSPSPAPVTAMAAPPVKPPVQSVTPAGNGAQGGSAVEGTELTYTVTLGGQTTAPTVYDFALGGGTAGVGDIGQPVFSNGVVLNPDGTITVPPGVTSFTVTVPTTPDRLDEPDETLPLTIDGIGGTGTIIDADGPPTISTVDVGAPGVAGDQVQEGKPLVYAATLSHPSTTPTTFSFALGGGSAAPNDIGPPEFSNGVVLNADGTITVPAGVTSFSIIVITVNDAVVEPDETLPLAIGGVTATGVILDDDLAPPRVTGVEPGGPGIGDDLVPEGTALSYAVTLSNPWREPVRLPFQLGGGTAEAGDHGAPVFSDGVVLNGDGTVTVPAGVSAFTVSVPTLRDGTDEPDETLPLTIGGVTGTGTILDGDAPPPPPPPPAPPPTVSTIEPGQPGIGDDKVPEGTDLQFKVSLSGPTTAPTTYPFSLGGGSAVPGDIGAPVFSDGVVLNPDGTITVPAGVSGFTVSVPTVQDGVLEPDETVPLAIGGVQAVGTITDGLPPVVTTVEPGAPGVAGDMVTEGASLVFTVSLSEPTVAPVIYPFRLGGGTAGAGDLGAPVFSDGVVLNGDGTITVPAGVAAFTVSVPTVDDTTIEQPESVPLIVGGVAAVGGILDNDGEPRITGIEPAQPGVGDDRVAEGTDLVYTVSLNNPVDRPVSFAFELGGGTAGAGDIGTPVFSGGVTLNPDGTITVPAGVTSFTITVPTTQDTSDEPDETVPLTIGGVTGTGTILDDDLPPAGPPTIDRIEPGQPGLADDTVPEGSDLVFSVTLTSPTTAPVSYPFSLGGGTAAAGDIGAPVFSNGVTLNPDGTITVPAGVAGFTVTVPTVDDTSVEPTETVPLAIGGVTASGGILDNDQAPRITGVEPGRPDVPDDRVPEGTNLVYTVSLSNPSGQPVSFAFELGGGTASAGDIGAPVFSNGVTLNPDGTITVPAGVTSFTVTVPTTQDTVDEPNETVPLTIGGVTGTGTILDDDLPPAGPPTIDKIEPGQPGIADDTVPEGTDLVFNVTLTSAPTAPVSYPFSLGGGTAAAGDIGSPVFSNGVTLNPDGTITVPAGVTSFSVTVPTTQDTTDEADETVPISIGGVNATGTIQDNDEPPRITGVEPGQPGVADDSTPEGTALVYTVGLSNPSDQPVKFAFELGGGTAGAGDIGQPVFSDGVTLNPDGTITVPAGVTSFTVTVPTTQDTTDEPDETVPLTIGGKSGTGTIVDDDLPPTGPPTIDKIEPGNPGVQDDLVLEGNPLVFNVTLTSAPTAPVSYPFNLGGGTASAGDIGAPVFSNGVTLNPDGTITVPAGVTSFSVTVPTTQDTTDEADETVPISIGGVNATGTIQDNDEPPRITGVEPGQPGVADDSTPEGTALVYTVGLSNPSDQPVKFAFELGGGTAGTGDIGQPVFSDGVTLNPDGTITVPAGVTSFTVTVPTTQDTTDEPDETVPLTIGGKSGTGTIVDDDLPPTGPPTIDKIEPGQPGTADDTVPEGTSLVFNVTLTSPTTEPVTYPFSIGGGTADASDGGPLIFSDGVVLNPDGTITVPAGVAGFTLTVPTFQDGIDEPDETVPVSIGGVSALGTITDGTPLTPPTIDKIEPGNPGVQDDLVLEGNPLVFNVTLTSAPTAPVSYPFSLGGGTAGAGDIGSPVFSNGVTLNPDGTITVPAGVTSFSVTVPTTQDTTDEADETVPISIGGVNATGTIQDNDEPPRITGVEPGQPGVADDSTPEGTALVYTVGLSNPSDQPVKFAFELGGGTAGTGDIGQPVFSDGVTLNPDGTITVPAGVTSFTVTVPTTQDTTDEPDETVPLTIGGKSGTGTIVDDDLPPTGPPTIDKIEPGNPGVQDDLVLEGNPLVFNVTLTSAPTAPVSYPFNLGGGTASAGDIGAPVFSNGVTLNPDGTITVPAGVTSFSVTVPTTQDTTDEADETVPVSIGGVNATGTIQDNDEPPRITGVEPGQPGVADDSTPEGTALVYTVGLSNPSDQPVKFAFELGGGTAGTGDIGQPVFSDGVTLNPDGTITVPAGVTSFTVTVPTTQDSTDEPDETVPLTIGGKSGTGTIVDDDLPPTGPPTIDKIEPGQPGTADDTVPEGTSLVFNVTLTSPTTEPVTYPFSIGGGTADASDGGPLIFSDGVVLNPDGTITVPAGVAGFTLTVPTFQDGIDEPDETVPVSIGGVSALGTITDGTPPTPPTIDKIEPGNPGVQDDLVLEGNPLVFNVTLTSAPTAPVSYPFNLGGGTAGAGDIGSPVFSNGVTLNPDGTITVPAGVTSFSVTVPTTQDTTDEADESVPISIGGVNATGTIQDNDELPRITGVEPGQPGPADDSVTEGTALVYTVGLSNPSDQPVKFAFELGGGTAGAGDIGQPVFSDGVTLNPDGTITVPAGVTSFTVTVPTTQDTTDEPDETVPLTIGGKSGTGTIVDDDAPTVQSVSPSPAGDHVLEGQTLAFQVTLSGTTTAPTQLAFSLGGGSAGAADIGQPVFSNGVVRNADGTLTVPAGVSTFTVSVPTLRDDLAEATETVPLSVGGVGATGYVDDDTICVLPPSATITAPTAPEGSALQFAVEIGQATDLPTRYAFELRGGTAAAGDFGAPVFTNGVTLNADGTITVPPGVSRFSISVPTTQDSLVEANETVLLNLGGLSSVGTIVDDDQNLAPVVGSATASVSEEGLAGGLRDGTGQPTDTTDSTTATGRITITDPEGQPISGVVLTAPTTALTSGGVPLTWSGSGTATLTASAGGQTVATVTIDDTGRYSVNLLKPLDHPTGGGENLLSVPIGVQASDGSRTGSGTLTLRVEDDAPVAVDCSHTVSVSSCTTNLMVVLDLSGSMDDASGMSGMTRLQAAVKSIEALIDRYDTMGDVAVRLVTFNSQGQALGASWTTPSEAKALLGRLDACGSTNYDDALADAMAAFGAPGKIAGGQNVSYFLSDGKPTAGSGSTSTLTGSLNDGADNGIQSAEAQQWRSFLDSHDIQSHAIGMGTGVGTSALAPIAWDGRGGVAQPAVVVDDFADLTSVLTAKAQVPSTGSLVASGLPGYGADGAHLSSISVGTVTYTVDWRAAGGAGAVTASDGSQSFQWDAATQRLTVRTTAGGELSVDMADGDYAYLPPQGAQAGFTDSVRYGLVDGDGDGAQATLSFSIPQPQTVASQLIGQEDRPLVIGWADLRLDATAVKADALQLGALPADGRLQVLVNGQWCNVAAGQTITKATIDGQGLRFVPDAHESGSDAYAATGEGNRRSTYTELEFNLLQGGVAVGTLAHVAVDVSALADAGAAVSQVTMWGWRDGAAPAGHSTWETVSASGSLAGTGGYRGVWHQVSFCGSNRSADVDGSEKMFFELKVNQVDVASAPTVVALTDGTILKPDAQGSYWVRADQVDNVWMFRQWGSGPNGTQYSHQSVSATAWNVELDEAGRFLHKTPGNTITSCTNTPLVLDLDGDGVRTLGADAGVQFDFDGDGRKESTGWAEKDDGLLVLDRDGDGTVGSGRELFGDQVTLADGSRAADGYAALADLDSNRDGRIDAGDAAFQQLKVWVDANSDGISQAGELRTLTEAGVSALSLDAQAGHEVQQGNQLAAVSTWQDVSGQTHAMADVWFGGPGSAPAAEPVDTDTGAVPAAATPLIGQEVFAWHLGDAAPADALPAAELLAGEPIGGPVLDLRDLMGEGGWGGGMPVNLDALLPPAEAPATVTGASVAAVPGAAAPVLHEGLSFSDTSADNAVVQELIQRSKTDQA